MDDKHALILTSIIVGALLTLFTFVFVYEMKTIGKPTPFQCAEYICKTNGGVGRYVDGRCTCKGDLTPEAQ